MLSECRSHFVCYILELNCKELKHICKKHNIFRGLRQLAAVLHHRSPRFSQRSLHTGFMEDSGTGALEYLGFELQASVNGTH